MKMVDFGLSRPLYGALLLTLLASVHGLVRLPPDTAALADDPLARYVGAQGPEAGSVGLGRETAAVPVTSSLFVIEEPVLPPVVPAAATLPAPPPPSLPQAPPISFQYMGRIEDDDGVRVFLRRGEEIHVVAIGEDLDNFYRIDSIDDKKIGLIYLPLNQVQSIPVR